MYLKTCIFPRKSEFRDFSNCQWFSLQLFSKFPNESPGILREFLFNSLEINWEFLGKEPFLFFEFLREYRIPCH